MGSVGSISGRENANPAGEQLALPLDEPEPAVVDEPAPAPKRPASKKGKG